MADHASVHVDAADFTRLSKALGRLPGELRHKAFRRTMARLERRAKSQVTKESSKHTDTAQKHVRPLIRARFVSEDVAIRVRSPWLSFGKLGAKQGRRGVSLRKPRRGTIRGAFMATMASGHYNAFIRRGKERTPIVGLYGANPAHAIVNDQDRYEALLAEIAERDGAARLLHEIGYLLRDV